MVVSHLQNQGIISISMKTEAPESIFEQRFTTRDDVTYSYSVANEEASRTIVIIHGVTGGKEDMEIMGELSVRRGYAVYLLDLPNHGASSAMPVENFEELSLWLRDAMRALDITPDILMGNSYASAICYTFAAQGFLPPQSKLILNCPTPDVALISTILGRILVRLPGKLPSTLYHSRALIFGRVNYLSRQRNDGSKELLHQSELRKIGVLDARVGIQMGNLMYSKHNPYRRYELPEEIQRRTVVTIGDRDNVVTSRTINGLRQLLPYAKFDIIRGAGHILHFEAPAHVVEHVEV